MLSNGCCKRQAALHVCLRIPHANLPAAAAYVSKTEKRNDRPTVHIHGDLMGLSYEIIIVNKVLKGGGGRRGLLHTWKQSLCDAVAPQECS